MQRSFGRRLKRDFQKNWSAYLLVLPVLVYFILFHYKPMYGVIIAFKKFSIRKGILGSPWVGLQYFRSLRYINYVESRRDDKQRRHNGIPRINELLLERYERLPS